MNNLSALPQKSIGRLYPEQSDHRSPYERDRDRIYHSTAFRKLKDKTQVFMFEKGDYYRNRLTHTLEVSQIARSISRQLHLNEDLAECIALCHDLGHSPFGHVGEEIIAQELDLQFDHNYQSFRQVTVLEKKYFNFDGLNLSWETLDGLIKHNGIIHNTDHNYNLSSDFKFNLNQNPSLEAQIATLSDDIAYIAHDFDDGIRAGIIHIDALAQLQDSALNFLDFNFLKNMEPKLSRNYISRSIVNYLVLDVIHETKKNVHNNNIQNFNEIIHYPIFLASFSNSVKEKVLDLKKYLFDNFYTSRFVQEGRIKAESILLFIISYLNDDIERLPKSWQIKIDSEESKKQTIIDYICGMTDQFAIKFYNSNAPKN